MDTSETYIEMTHAAFPNHDVVPVGRLTGLGRDIFIDQSGQYWADGKGWFVPIYRQDQLQELYLVWVNRDYLKQDIASALISFGNFVSVQLFGRRSVRTHLFRGDEMHFDKNAIVFTCKPDTTAEQLWLAFIMKQEFGKIWDENDWVKDGTDDK